MQTEPKLTIGMAHYEDFYGLWATLQSLAMHNREDVNDVEFIVVENSPPGEHRDEAKRLVENFMHVGTAGAQYIELPPSSGTTKTRQAVFDHARSDNVLVMDCHVFVDAGAIKKLKDWFADNKKTKAIVSGPMLYDDRHNQTTHFHNEWRGQMWGTWSHAWKCECGQHFSMFDDGGIVKYCTLEMEHKTIYECQKCGKAMPENVAWPGHEVELLSLGWEMAGTKPSDEPFEIPGMGLGLFACRKPEWPGFVEHAAGFGAEELCVHEAMRQSGGVALCVPFMRWLHRFPRPGGVKYTLLVESKIRNYVLWFNLLGRPLDEIHQHFVADEKLITQTKWERLVADPVGFTDGIPVLQQAEKCSTCGSGKSSRPQPPLNATLDQGFEWCKTVPRDLNEHFDLLKKYASEVSHATVIAKRREAALAVLAGRPAEMVVFDTEKDDLYERIHEWASENIEKLSVTAIDDFNVQKIEPTELLFIDTIHSAKQLMQELSVHGSALKRFLIVRGTTSFGEMAEGDAKSPGLLPGLRWWMTEHPEWSVIHHAENQYGMTVLSCDSRDKPKLPCKIKMAANFAKATVDHALAGAKATTQEVLEQRLSICSTCPHRNVDNCSICGCPLAKKASWQEQPCPIGKWPSLETEEVVA